MRPMLNVMPPYDGSGVYPIFRDSAEIITAYRSGEILKGNKLFYNGMICEVIDECYDLVTGEPIPELLAEPIDPMASYRIYMG